MLGDLLKAKAIRLIALLMAMVFVFAACGDDGAGTRGGTLKVGTTDDSVTLDPALLTTNPDIWVAKTVANNLVSWTHQLTVQPELATEWEVNDDLTSYTFKLRKKVKFHSGKEFKAEDVVFTFKRILDEKNASPARAQLDFIADIVAIDDHTVRFDLNSPSSFLPEALALYQGKIIPNGTDSKSLTNHLDGTGAYMLTERIPGERAVLTRNPDYWEDGKPYFDEVIFFFMADNQARLEALKTGALDVSVPLGAAEASGLKSGATGIKVESVASGSYMVVSMENDVPPFDNLKVRQAIQMATDRDSIQKASFFGLGIPGGDHPIPPSDPYYNTDSTVPAYDPAGAKKLLAEAGYPDGIEVTLNTAPVFGGMVEMAVAFKESVAPAGIKVNIKRHPSDGYWSNVWLKEPMTTVNWFHRNPDGALSIVMKSDAKWNEAHYKSAELDSYILAARAARTEEEKKEIYGKAQVLLNTEVPRIIVYFMPVLVAMRDNVQDIKAHPSNNFIVKDGYFGTSN